MSCVQEACNLHKWMLQHNVNPKVRSRQPACTLPHPELPRWVIVSALEHVGSPHMCRLLPRTITSCPKGSREAPTLWGCISNMLTTVLYSSLIAQPNINSTVRNGWNKDSTTGHILPYFMCGDAFKLLTSKSHNTSVITANPMGTVVDRRTWNAPTVVAVVRECVKVLLTVHKMTQVKWCMTCVNVYHPNTFFNAKYISHFKMWCTISQFWNSV